MTEHNLPDKDDAPWLDTTYDGFNWKPEKNISSPWDVDVWENNIGQPVSEQVADGLKEAFREAVKQGVVSSSTKSPTLYDVIADWWDEIFDVNPPPIDRNGEYLDKTYVIMDLVKAISEIKR